MKKYLLLIACLFGVFSIPSTRAALYEINISAEVTANQSNSVTHLCAAQGFTGCPYFPLQDIVTMTMIYDDSTPIDPLGINNTNRSTYANAFTSISLSNSLFTSTYSNGLGFGQFSITDNTGGTFRDRLAIRLWDSVANTGFPGSADPMHLTPIDTTIAQASDDVFGDIEIRSILINLVGLDDLLFNSKSLPTSLSISGLDLANSNWGVNLSTLGTNAITKGFAGSAGGGIKSVSIKAVAVPEPSVMTLMVIGLSGLGFSVWRKKT